MKHLLPACLLLLLTTPVVGAPPPANGTLSMQPVQPQQMTLAQTAMLNNQPLYFIENKGQVVDQFGKPRKDIDFKVAVKGMNVFVGNGALHYMLSSSKARAEGNKPMDAKIRPDRFASNKPTGIDLYRLDVKLLGANKKAKVTSEEGQDYNEIDYLAQCPDGIVAHAFHKIVYHEVYPNIDWVLYIRNNKLEYDFIVRPGGRVSDIRMAYGGATDLSVRDDKGLAAVTPLGTIVEKQPVSYQQEGHKVVASRFALHGKVATFEVANYEGTLVIDPNPNLDWATYYGGTNYDYGWSVTCDATGNVYMVGSTVSPNNIATTGSFHTSTGTWQYEDAFLVKFNPAGGRMWGIYYGGSNFDRGLGGACDPAGNIYMVGTTSSSGLATPGSYHSSVGTSIAANDGFIVKFNASGSRLWASYFGGGGTPTGMPNYYRNCGGVDIACDQTGNAYLTGWTSCDTGIATPGSYQRVLNAGLNATNNDAFLAKFSPIGTLLWATYFGGGSSDAATSVACDDSGHIYIKGETNSLSHVVTPGAYQTVYNGLEDGFLAQFNSAGLLQWSTYFGSHVIADHHTVACDHYGHVYICDGMDPGYATPGSFQTAGVGVIYNAYLAQFNTAGSMQWATYYGGSADAVGVACDNLGYVYLTGGCSGSGNIATPGSYQTTFGPSFMAKFNSTGQRKWGTYYNFVDAKGIACHGGSIVYVAGWTTDTVGVTTPGSFQPTFGGWVQDAILERFSSVLPPSEVQIAEPFKDTVLCAGSTFNLNYTVTDSFNTGNVFTAQLSDATGSFATPVNIGSSASIGNGTISCTMPAGTIVGTGYKIRITASTPGDTSVTATETISVITLAGMTATSTSGCLGAAITLKADSLIAGQTYHWTGPNGLIQSGSTVIIPNSVYADSGNYLVVSTVGGCTKTDVVHVGIIPGPAKPIAKSNSPVCAGDTILLKGSNITAGAGFSWSGPVSFHSLLLNPVLTSVPLSDSGLYILTANLDGCTQSDTILVMVTKPVVPTVTVTTTTSPLVPGYPATYQATVYKCPNPTYQWYHGASPLSGKTASTLTTTFVQNDNIKVVVHCTGCVNPNSAAGIYTAPVGITSVNKGMENVVVYPNPVSDFLTIEHAGGATARLCNVLGQVLVEQVLVNDQERLNTAVLPSGTFVLTLVSGDIRWSKVMVKE